MKTKFLSLFLLQNLFSVLILAKPPEAAPPQKTQTIEQHWNIAREHFQKKQFLEGATQLQKLVLEHPDHHDARPIGAWFFWEAAKRLNGDERLKLEKQAEDFIQGGLEANKDSWFYLRELGDFYKLRVGSITKSHVFYQQAVEHFESASSVQKAALLSRLARSAEELGRKGDAVKASCQALEHDPKDKMALNRIKKLSGSCERKGIKLDQESEILSDPKNPTTDEATSPQD